MSDTDDQRSASDVAKEVFATLVDKLNGAKTAGPPRQKPLFFPDGIELIDIVVTVGNVKAEIKVAGEKGLHLEESALSVPSADPDPA